MMDQFRADPLLADVEALVSCESPSQDLAALARCAEVLDTIGTRRLGVGAEHLDLGGRVALRWQFGTSSSNTGSSNTGTRVVLLGHLDTVWPFGTIDRWPFEVDGDRMTGPGVFDMKAGLVQMLAATEALPDRDGVTLLVTSDEEIGSNASIDLIESVCRDARAVLVLEPSADGALKIARKGVGMFTVGVTGRAAHAGLEPERGINATVEVAHQILAIAALGQADVGTTVTPSVMSGGTTVNTVPATATVAVDVRAETVAEMERVESGLRSLTPRLPGAEVKVVAESVRAPFEKQYALELFEHAQKHAAALGLGPVDGVSVGGGSDGNLTAALGVPTLDGLGAVGGNAHAEGEWASASALPERTALVSALVRDLLEETR